MSPATYNASTLDYVSRAEISFPQASDFEERLCPRVQQLTPFQYTSVYSISQR